MMRDNIQKLKPYKSARDSYDSGILLDANENSFGSVVDYNGTKLNRYPDPKHNNLREALSNYLSMPKKNIFCGVGSDETIDLLIRIFCKPALDNVIIAEPTYGMYKVACDINDVETKTVLLNDNFQIDKDAIISAIDKNTKMLFLCSPNNPTGNLLNKYDIISICEKLDIIVVVDEAYIDFALDQSVINDVLNLENLVVSRTFSKAWGLAGIRLGYAIANYAIINTMMNVKAPYNINSATQNIGLRAIENVKLKEQFVKKLMEEKYWLETKLKRFSAIEKIFHSDANYILFKIKNAKELQLKLADNGVIIRDRSSQVKLENCLRISIGTRDENEKFISELGKLL